MVEDIDLRGIADKGFVRFSIKAEDNPHNLAVHAAFKDFCAIECDNNYTQGLKKLLESYESDARFDILWEKLQAIELRVQELEKAGKPVVKEVSEGVF